MILAWAVQGVRAHWRAAAELVWPAFCPRCEQRAERAHTWFCESCWNRLRPVEDAEVPGLVAAYAVDALFLEVLGAGKYRRSRAVMERMSRAGAERIAPRLPQGVLVPVPLTASRRRERGFNQSEIFAGALARAAGRDVAVGWLARRRGGKSLAGRARQERAGAIAGAFVATRRHPGEGAPPAVLVDDVYTTGSTLGDCARAFTAAGGKVAGLAVLGRAFSSRDDEGLSDSQDSWRRFA